jgi:rapamycin-insensitive companion of mTOR
VLVFLFIVVALCNAKVVALSGGLKVIIPAIIDGPKELAETILYTLIYILDREDSRSYVRPYVEIEMLLANFTDVYGKGQAYEDKLNNCGRAIIALLRTWTGKIKAFCLT